MELPKELTNEIWDYCRVNNIPNIEAFTIRMVKQGFTVEKFGATPNTPIPQQEKEEVKPIPLIETKVAPPITTANTKTDIYGEV